MNCRVGLADSFAWDLLFLEIELEMKGCLTPAGVGELSRLYAVTALTRKIGIEHFEAREDDRYLYFKRKMDSFLHNPVIITTLKNQTSHKPAITEHSPLVRKEKLKKTILMQSKAVDFMAVKELVLAQTKELYSLEERIVKECEGQQDTLNARLQQRKARAGRGRMAGSLSTPLFNPPEEEQQDKKQEAGPSQASLMARLKEALEDEDENG
jgi:hypothetical protein